MRGIAILFSFLILTSGSAFAADTIKTDVRAGKTSMIYRYVFYDPDRCGALQPAKLTKPKAENGKIRTQSSRATIDKGPCKGRSFPAVGILYTPKAGFRGKDTASINLVTSIFTDGTGRRVKTVKFELNVR